MTMEKEILNVLQEGIPLTKSPFNTLGQKLGLLERELIERIKELKDQKIIRQISPIYDTKMLGYQSALVAFQVEKEKLEGAAEFINTHPGVSHNYERNHSFNLWFTLAVPPDGSLSLEKTVEFLKERTGARRVSILHSKRVFKIRVKLDVKEKTGSQKEEEKEIQKNLYQPLSDREIQVVRVTQRDLPLNPSPFQFYGEELGMEEEEVLHQLDDFLKRGVARRFAAILNHRKAGFKANGMAVWKIDPQRMEEVGKAIAAYKGVSHCYERTTSQDWPYNLFSMIHGQTREEVEEMVQKMALETKPLDFQILYSQREFKKIRLQYFLESFYDWEKEHSSPF